MTFRQVRTAVLLLTGAALVPAVASAQDGATAGDDEILVTAQRNNETQVLLRGNVGVLGDKDAADVPFSVRSYNAAIILNQQPNTLGELLLNDPTIRTTYGFGNAAELFVIRGFPLYGDDIGLDGLYGIAPRQLIAPELYDQVQVLNGATAFLNGAAPGGSGLGGSVNLRMKRADRTLNRVTANYTSDEHFGGSFDVARRYGDGGEWGVRINGAARTGDVATDGEYRSAYVVAGAFDYRGESFRLSLDLAYQRFKVRGLRPKVTLPIGATAVPRPPKAAHNFAQPWTYIKLRDIFGIVKGEWDVADNAMLYASFGARDGMEEGIYDGLTVLDAGTGAANANALYVPRTDNNEAATTGARIKLEAGGITQEVNLGGSINWQVNRNAYDFLYGPGFVGYASNLYDTPKLPVFASSNFIGGDLDDPYPISRTRLGSIFASDTIGFLDDRILITGGFRIQSINVKSYSAFGGALQSEYDENAVTPVVGVVVKPATGVSLFANRIEGLQQGSVAPLTGLGLPVSNPNQVFAPYKTVQYEFGGKIVLGKVNASIAAFQIALPLAQLTLNPDGQSVRYGLDGEQRNRGIEFTLDAEPVDGLRLIGGGAVTRAKLRDTQGGLNEGNKAPGVPDYTLNANVEWDLPFAPGLTLTGRVTHTGEQKVDQANTLEIPDWTRFDVGARFVTVISDKPVTFRVNVDNVANKRYWASSFDAFNQALLQGLPRTFKASASIDF